MTRIHTPDERHPTALAPDLRRLDDRAARAWAEPMAVRKTGRATYRVTTGSDHGYMVDLDAHTCTCPDHAFRDERCKHLRRVAIEITARRVAPPGMDRARCDVCGESTHVPSDASPPDLCADCRLEPGEVVLDRETGDRLVVLGISPDRADAYVVEAVGKAVAEFETNDGYPADDVVVEVAYLPAFYRKRSPRTYAFPHSRLTTTDAQFLSADPADGQQELPPA